MPKDSFLEILFDIPENPIIIERTFHLDDFLPNMPNFSGFLNVTTPCMNNKRFHEGMRIEVVIKIFEDSSRSTLLGEHHEFITYNFSSDQLQQSGLQSSLGLNRSRVFQQKTFKNK